MTPTFTESAIVTALLIALGVGLLYFNLHIRTQPVAKMITYVLAWACFGAAGFVVFRLALAVVT